MRELAVFPAVGEAAERELKGGFERVLVYLGVSTVRGAMPVFLEASSTPRGVAMLRGLVWIDLIAVELLGVRGL